MRAWALLLLLCAGCAASLPETKAPVAAWNPPASWTQEGGDASQRSLAPVEPPMVWRPAMHRLVEEFSADPIGEVAAPLAAGDLFVVASTSRRVLALDRATLKTLWSHTTQGRVYASPAVDGPLVFVADDVGYVEALEGSTGAVKWRFLFPNGVLSPLVAEGGRLYVQDSAGSFACLSGSDGALLWKFGKTLGSATAGFWRGARAAVGEGRVFLGLSDGFVQALDAAYGKPLWRTRIASSSLLTDVVAGPSVADGVVIAGTREGPLTALNAATGDVLWKNPLGVAGGIAVSGDRLFVGTVSGKLAAVSRADGTLLWTTPADAGLVLAPVAAGSKVVAGWSSGALAAFDAESGKRVNEFRTGTGVAAQPWIGESGMAFLSSAGVFYKIDATVDGR